MSTLQTLISIFTTLNQAESEFMSDIATLSTKKLTVDELEAFASCPPLGYDYIRDALGELEKLFAIAIIQESSNKQFLESLKSEIENKLESLSQK